jgi:hypothetical protein
MGVLEEGGKAATAAVSGLATQPLVLAIVCINIIFLFGTGYTLFNIMDRVNAANIRHDAQLTKLMDSCGKRGD